MCEESKLNIPSECILEYLNGRWNIEIAVSKEKFDKTYL